MSLKKNLGMAVLTQLFSWGLTLGVSLKLPQYLGDANLGRFELAGSIAGAFSVLVVLGTSRVLTRDIARDTDKFTPLLRTALKLRLALALPAVLLGLLLTLLLRYDTTTRLLVALSLLVMVITCISDALGAARAGREEFGRINAAQLTEKLTTGALLLLLAILKAPLWLFFVAMLIPVGLSLAILWPRENSPIGRSVAHEPDSIHDIRALAREGMPFLSNAIFVKLYGTSAPLLLSGLGSLQAVGWFALAKRLGGSTLFVPAALCSVMLPRLSASWQNDRAAYTRDVRRMYLLLGACTLPFSAVLVLFPGLLLRLLHYPASFTPAIPVIALMGVSGGLWFMTQGAATALIAADKQAVFARLTGIAAAACFPLGAVCILAAKALFNNAALGAIAADALIEGGLLVGYLQAVSLAPHSEFENALPAGRELNEESSVNLTVLICTRSRPNDIAWVVPGVLACTHPSFEVIVVDQSDDDKTKQLLEPLAQKDARLRYVPTETRGLSRARNLGASLARGTLIVCTDDDCEVAPHWLNEVEAVFAADPAIDMGFGQVYAPEGADFEREYVPCSYFTERRSLDREIMGMGAHMILKRKLWEQVGNWDEALGSGGVFPGAEDFDFSYRAQRLGATVMMLPELSLIHRTGRPKSFFFEKQLFDYGLGEAAFCLKHVRCGDLWALKRLLGVLVLYSGRAVWRGLRRRPDATGFLRGMLAGLARALKISVDTKRRVYIP